MGCSVAIAASHASNVGANGPGRSPTSYVLARVRWGNVGRVVGVVVAVAVVVAWPRLGGDALVAPGGAAVPVVVATPVPDAGPGGHDTAPPEGVVGPEAARRGKAGPGARPRR